MSHTPTPWHVSAPEELSMEAQFGALEKAVHRALRERRILLEACSDALEYFEDRSDVVDGDEGIPQANHEMTLAQTLKAAIDYAETT